MSQQNPSPQRGMFWFLPRGGPAVALGVVSLIASGAVAYSHYAQVREKEVMRAGVERDRERVRGIRRKQRDELSLQQAGMDEREKEVIRAGVERDKERERQIRRKQRDELELQQSGMGSGTSH